MLYGNNPNSKQSSKKDLSSVIILLQQIIL